MMPYQDLDALYKALDDFQADLEVQEVEMLRGALTAIKTAIHQRMQESIKNR